MARTLHLLLIADGTSLKTEVETALADLPEEMRLVVHAEPDMRRGIEHALNRRPDVVLLELEGGLEDARRAAIEISGGITPPLIVAVYRQQVLGSNERSAAVLIELMRAKVKDFLRRPLSSTELEDLLRRHFWSSERAETRRGRIVSFIGNKGGVGKSTLSLSVACAVARRSPGRVLLVDASLQHGAMCDLLTLKPEATICDAVLQIERLDERLLRMLSVQHESGLRVLAAPPNAIDAAPVDDQALARILSVARQAFDVVIVDTFPLIDSVTVAILDVSDLVFVVLNDFVPAVLGTVELLAVLDRLGISSERIRVVLNHTHSGFRGRLKDVDVATRLGHDLDFVVPYSRQIPAAMNTGDPYVLRAPRWRGFGRAVRLVEEEVSGWNPDGLVAPGASLPDEEAGHVPAAEVLLEPPLVPPPEPEMDPPSEPAVNMGRNA